MIAVYALASGSDGGPLLWSWLRDVYGEDDDGASDLASLANDV